MWRKILGGCLCLLFISHFIIVIIYNAPSNPVQAKFKKQISMYIDPVFTQNWRLFAPRPVMTNQYYYTKARLDDGTGNIEETGWIDLTKYMYAKNHKNRFTPFNRLLRIPRGAYTLTAEHDESIIRIMQKINAGELEEKDYDHLINNEVKKTNRELANNIINRFAESQLVGSFPDKKIVEFKVLLVESSPIPFSEKDNKNYEQEEISIEFEWTKPQNVLPWF